MSCRSRQEPPPPAGGSHIIPCRKRGRRALALILLAGIASTSLFAIACNPAVRRDDAASALTDFPLNENPADVWTQYAGGAEHDTFIGGKLCEIRLAGVLNKKPIFENYNAQMGGMVAAEGRIFVPNDHGRLLSIDTESGEVVWQSPPRFGANRRFTSMTYDRGLLFCGTFPGGLACIDAKTGSFIWEQESSVAIKGIRTSPLVIDDKLFFADIESNVFKLDALSGREEWAMKLSGAEIAQSDPVLAGGYVIYGTPAGILYALRPETGEVGWVNAFFLSIPSSPANVEGMVYFTGIDGGMNAVNPESGEIELSFSMSGRSATVPLVYRDRIVAGDDDNFVYCITGSTGELAWKTELSTPAGDLFLGFEDAIVTFASLAAIYQWQDLALARARGALDEFIRKKGPFRVITVDDLAKFKAEKIKGGSTSESTPEPRSISDAELKELEPNQIKALYAMRAEVIVLSWDGEIIDEIPLPAPLKSSPVLIDGKIYALDIEGNIQVFEYGES